MRKIIIINYAKKIYNQLTAETAPKFFESMILLNPLDKEHYDENAKDIIYDNYDYLMLLDIMDEIGKLKIPREYKSYFRPFRFKAFRSLPLKYYKYRNVFKSRSRYSLFGGPKVEC